MFGMNKKKKKMKGFTVPIRVTEALCDLYINYIFTQNELMVTKKSLLALSDYINIIDLDYNKSCHEVYVKLTVIRSILDMKLNKNINDMSLMIEHLSDTYSQYSDVLENNVFELMLHGDDILVDEIHWLQNHISERMKFSFLYKYSDAFKHVFEMLETESFDSMYDLNSAFKSLITGANIDIRKAENLNKDNRSFNLTDKASNLDAMLTELKRPSSFLTTGIKLLNQMLGGKGLESSRCTLFAALSGVGKSMLLLHIAYWIKKYCKNFQPKDPSKRPTVLILTLENTEVETFERLHDIVLEGKKDIRQQPSIDDIIQDFEDVGFISNENNIDIEVVYRDSKSICTLDIYGIIDEMEQDGKEVVCLILDYIERIRSSLNHQELRHELGAVVDDCCSIARHYKIPVVSAAQFGRDALKITEELKAKENDNDAAKKLNISLIGESWQIVKNADNIIIIDKTFSKSKKKWFFSFNNGKKRGKKQAQLPQFFYIPTKADSDGLLDEDLLDTNPEGKAIYTIVDTIKATSSGSKPMNVSNLKSVIKSVIPNSTDQLDDVED